jgi:hypothetical protein
MTVTMIGPAGTRVGSEPGPGLRAVLHGIDCHHCSVRTGQRVRPPAVGGANSHPGRARDAMRDRMSRRAPTPKEATP